ncbi:general transcription factor 3C polypeptide 2 isoform X1, partial [Tachysurus ichikawai]
MTVKVGSSQADHSGRSGLCFTLDWLPVKPHNVLAAGFSD